MSDSRLSKPTQLPAVGDHVRLRNGKTGEVIRATPGANLVRYDEPQPYKTTLIRYACVVDCEVLLDA